MSAQDPSEAAQDADYVAVPRAALLRLLDATDRSTFDSPTWEARKQLIRALNHSVEAEAERDRLAVEVERWKKDALDAVHALQQAVAPEEAMRLLHAGGIRHVLMMERSLLGSVLARLTTCHPHVFTIDQSIGLAQFNVGVSDTGLRCLTELVDGKVIE